MKTITRHIKSIRNGREYATYVLQPGAFLAGVIYFHKKLQNNMFVFGFLAFYKILNERRHFRARAAQEAAHEPP